MICHTSPRACVCMISTTGTTQGKLEPPEFSPRAGFALLYMDTESLCFVHALAHSRTPHIPVGEFTVYPLPSFSHKDHDLYTRESQVNEILHMFSIHKMACIVPLDMM